MTNFEITILKYFCNKVTYFTILIFFNYSLFQNYSPFNNIYIFINFNGSKFDFKYQTYLDLKLCLMKNLQHVAAELQVQIMAYGKRMFQKY